LIPDKILYERTDFSFHAEMKTKDAYTWNIKRLNWLIRRDLDSGVYVSPMIRELANNLGTTTGSTAQSVMNARIDAVKFWETKVRALYKKNKDYNEIHSNKWKASRKTIQEGR